MHHASPCRFIERLPAALTHTPLARAGAAPYARACGELWRHHLLEDSPHGRLNLVRYATLAASSHNTQPWKFKLAANRIEILPDLSRRCAAVDPDDHHLYASLGCAAENLLLAAQAAGLKGHCGYDAAASRITVDFETTKPSRTVFFEAIPRRQCSRCAYDGSALSPDVLRLLEQAANGQGVHVVLLSDNRQKEQIADYVAAGNTAQFADRAWAAELKNWIRFNAREAIKSGDGLYGPVMGSPDVPRWLGQLAMRFAFSADKQNRKDIAHIRGSSAIAVVYSEQDNAAHWIEAGRCYQRLALQATALDLRTAFINQPVEVATLRGQFAAFLGIGHRRPDLVLRIGRGPVTPRSLRRPVAEIIV